MECPARLHWFARVGYAARGLVFLVFAYFAILAAIGTARPIDSKEAMRQLLSQPFGKILLAAMAARLRGGRAVRVRRIRNCRSCVSAY
jgi:hypothetical protein